MAATDEPEFNMALWYYLKILIPLFTKIDEFACNGQILHWYRALKTLYRRIAFKFTPKEIDEIDALFKEATISLSSSLNVRGGMAKQVQDFSMLEVELALDKIDKRVMQIMDERRMIFPKFKLGGMSLINERFKL